MMMAGSRKVWRIMDCLKRERRPRARRRLEMRFEGSAFATTFMLAFSFMPPSHAFFPCPRILLPDTAWDRRKGGFASIIQKRTHMTVSLRRTQCHLARCQPWRPCVADPQLRPQRARLAPPLRRAIVVVRCLGRRAEDREWFGRRHGAGVVPDSPSFPLSSPQFNSNFFAIDFKCSVSVGCAANFRGCVRIRVQGQSEKKTSLKKFRGTEAVDWVSSRSERRKVRQTPNKTWERSEVSYILRPYAPSACLVSSNSSFAVEGSLTFVGSRRDLATLKVQGS